MNEHQVYRYDSDIGYTFVPNLKARIPHESGGYLLKTNSLGFRSDTEPGGAGKQVFVFGDSFTAGDGVSNGKRWTDRLGDLVPGAEFHNFGLSGSGTDQQYLIWNKIARSLKCDLVVVAILVENIRRLTSAFRPVNTPDGTLRFKAKPYFKLQDSTLRRFHDPVPRELLSTEELKGAALDTFGRYPSLRKLVKTLGMKAFVQQLSAYQPVPDFDDPQSEGWRLMRAIMTQWSAACASPMVIVPLPLYQHVEETADATSYQARFTELSREVGRQVIDPLPELKKYDKSTRRGFRFAKDVHLTPDGHAAVARAVAPGLREALGLGS